MSAESVEVQVAVSTSGAFFLDRQSLYDQTYHQSERTRRDDTEIKFNELLNEWRAQRSGASSFASSNATLPAYQFIIGMGDKVLPYILRELSKEDEDWYWALKVISREDPVPEQYRGQRRIMRQLWLEWGKTKKYAW